MQSSKRLSWTICATRRGGPGLPERSKKLTTRLLQGYDSQPRQPPSEDNTLFFYFRNIVFSTGLTNMELAKRSGIHRSTISNMLSGTRIGTLRTWSRLLDSIDVELGYRFKETND